MPSSRRRRAAIVLVDVDDHPLAPATLDAVRRAAGDRDEIVIVDVRSTPGRSWLAADEVTIVPGRPEMSSAALRAEAWSRAHPTAEVFAFVDARLSLEDGWLERAMAELEADPTIGAVTAYVGGVPTLNFTGNVGARHPVVPRERARTLFANPELAIYRRGTIEDAGGLPVSSTWTAAVVSVGWTTALRGIQTILLPDLDVDGRCTCEVDGIGGLETLYLCLGPEALESTLPAAIHIATARDARSTPAGSSTVDRFLGALPALEQRRRALQEARTVGDEDLLPRFVTALEPGIHDDHLTAEFHDVVQRHGLRDVFETRQRILIVTPDILTERMAGPAIRAWQIAEALADRHVVTLASTATTCEVSSPRFTVVAPGDIILRRLARDVDVVIGQGFGFEGRPYLRAEDKVVVADLYDPLHLEQLELFRDDTEDRRRLTIRESTRILNEQLVRGDFFVCASTKQRDFWLGQLAGLGRVNFRTYDADNRLADLLAVVPFGIPDERPAATGPAIKGVVPGIEEGDDVILWGGGIYNWFDPLTLIRAVDRLRHDLPNVRLFFMGLRHPNPEVIEMRVATEARRLSRQLGLTDRFVFFNEGWVPYSRRQDYLLEATIGVSTHYDHLETEFSFRTRLLDYIWAGLPMVATEGDWFADLIRNRGLGLVAPSEDVEALASALRRVLTDAPFAAACRAAVEELRPELHWSRVLEPLTEFCRSPRRAPDLGDLQTRATLWATDEDRLQDFLRHQPTVPQRLRQLLRAP